MANGYQVNKVILRGTAQSVGASETNTALTPNFPISEGDSKVMSVMLAVSDAVVATGITAKLQDSHDGGTTWRDAGSVALADVNIQSSLEIEDLTYTAVTAGTAGDNITIAYIDDGTAGAETVDVTGTDIVVHMEAAASTANQIKAAIEAEEDATDLVSVAVTGTGTDAQAAAAEAPLAGGAEPNGVFEIVHSVYDGSTDPLWGIARVTLTTGADDSATVSQVYITRRR